MTEDEKLDKQIDYFNAIGDQHGFDASTWSIHEVEDMNSPHPCTGATTVRYDSHAFWGEPSGIFEEPINGATWLALWRAANTILERCGDKHHVFIESFEPDASGKVLTLWCGS